jgi:hypothetical protein
VTKRPSPVVAAVGVAELLVAQRSTDGRAREVCPPGPGNRRFGRLGALRPYKKRRRKSVHCGDRYGSMNAPGGPGQSTMRRPSITPKPRNLATAASSAPCEEGRGGSHREESLPHRNVLTGRQRGFGVFGGRAAHLIRPPRAFRAVPRACACSAPPRHEPAPRAPRRGSGLGFGRIVFADKEAPNMLVNLV